jgi:nucleotidyltransferase substrate binding protein (TIGR01987 family)
VNRPLQSLGLAIDRLDEALAMEPSDVVRDAAIQRFEFCFELAWKALQQRLREEGLDCASPKSCLTQAHRQGWLEEEPWLAMLEDRNLTSHTYDEALAQKVYDRLNEHLPALRSLVDAISGER